MAVYKDMEDDDQPLGERRSMQDWSDPRVHHYTSRRPPPRDNDVEKLEVPNIAKPTASYDTRLYRPGDATDMAKSSHGSYRRPLIDQVTNRWREEKGRDYVTSGYNEEDPGVPCCDLEDDGSCPNLTRDLLKTRKFRRMLVVIIVVLLVCYYGWKWYLRPQFEEERGFKEGFLHERLKGTYGVAKAGDFHGARIKDLDGSLLPGGDSDPEGKRRLVFVGDIHGCKKELAHLLDKIGFDKATDHLVATGDVISKGPDSLGVLDKLIDLNAESVRGNHEDRSLESARTVLQSAAKQAYTSKGQTKDAELLKQMKSRHLRYLRDMPLMLRIPALPQSISAAKKKGKDGDMKIQHEIIIVHAGLVPSVPLDRQDPYFVMNMRTIDHRTHAPSALREGSTKSDTRPWYEIWNWYNDRLDRGRSLRGFLTLPPPTKQHPGPQEESSWLSTLFSTHKEPSAKPTPHVVVYGHDSKSNLQIHPWSRGLDSACVAGGELTAMVLSADGSTELVSVKCKNYKD